MAKQLDAQAMGTVCVGGAWTDSPEPCCVSNAHGVDVTVSAVPSNVVIGEEFSIRVGVQCSAGCNTAGQEVEVYDHLGTRLVTARLGQTPGTEGSSAVTVTLRAPSVEGRYRWTVEYLASDLEVPHEEARSTFAFAAATRSEHVVTVEALTKEDGEPIPEARLVLRPHVYQGSRYSSRTDETGVGRVHVPKGVYQLYVTGGLHEKLVPTVVVDDDVTIQVVLTEPIHSWRMLPW